MQNSQAIKELKDKVKKAYIKATKNIDTNIYRGYSEDMSSVVENSITLFIKNLLPNGYEFYIDPSININKKLHRPDLLIIDTHKHVKAMIEIKANMGHCRKTQELINKIRNNHILFAKQKNLICSFPVIKNGVKVNSESKGIVYPKRVKCFLVTFTQQNCSKNYHEKTYQLTKQNHIGYFKLFDQWYGNPKNLDIEKFAEQIKQITK